MKYYCRCRKCQARQICTGIVANTKCRQCGDRALRIDQWAQNKGWRKRVCRCDGYHYPHHRGSRNCYYNNNGSAKTYEELYGELSESLSLDSADDSAVHRHQHPSDEYF